MLLLTGATGRVGAAVLRSLVAEGTEVRCLVRDSRRLRELIEQAVEGIPVLDVLDPSYLALAK